MTAVHEAVAARADDSPGAVPAACRTALVVTAGMVLLGAAVSTISLRGAGPAGQRKSATPAAPGETVDGRCPGVSRLAPDGSRMARRAT
ncbi:hypothetical protein [Streptomyces albus]|uniref:hypothetical protein n=1 Tax=Streptomyces albus TaxID=1888 RepID=UPI0034558298